MIINQLHSTWYAWGVQQFRSKTFKREFYGYLYGSAKAKQTIKEAFEMLLMGNEL